MKRFLEKAIIRGDIRKRGGRWEAYLPGRGWVAPSAEWTKELDAALQANKINVGTSGLAGFQ